MARIMEHKSRAGSFYLVGIGFAVMLVGAVFMYFMWKSYSQASLTRTWTKTPAVMIVSAMKNRSAEHISKEYSWSLEYAYAYEGEEYTSKFNTPRGAKWTSRKMEIQGLVDAKPENSNVFCYVNPENPKQAILTHDIKAADYSIWFPAIFVVGGLGMMWGSIKRMKPC